MVLIVTLRSLFTVISVPLDMSKVDGGLVGFPDPGEGILMLSAELADVGLEAHHLFSHIIRWMLGDVCAALNQQFMACHEPVGS